MLQEGIREGDECLFVSTEQTLDELRDTFDPYAYDLDHGNLTVTSVHARPGYTLEDAEERLTIETLEGDQTVGEGYAAPFSARYVSQMLGRYAPADRVVVDSVSGLRAMADDPAEFRRAVLDLVRLFADEFEATSLLVSEEGAAPDEEGGATPLQYTTHGVIRLWIDEVRNDVHRFVRVRKMRGLNHDTRPYEMEFDGGGVYIVPRNRNATEFWDAETSFVDTRIDGLDALLGGGFVRGNSVVVEHDGRATLRPLFLSLVKRHLETESAVLLLMPKIGADRRILERLFPDDPGRITDLLDADALFVVDVTGGRTIDHENVLSVTERSGVEYLLRLVDERRGDRPLASFVDTETAARRFGAEQTVDLHRRQETHPFGDGVAVYVHNPRTLSDEVAEFFANGASQVLELWRHDTGLQYLTLEKSPAGYVGATRLVDTLDEPPFVRVQFPPGCDGARTE